MYKTNNLVIVGGMISAGKSTLVKRLSEKTGWEPIYERMEEDRLNEIILQHLYAGERLHDATTQTFFTTMRAEVYKRLSSSIVPKILDRAIWEDILFSEQLMDTNGYQFVAWKKYSRNVIDRLVEEYGKPKVYIFLTVDWENFRERIYNRNFESEIANFAKNEDYFRALLEKYNNEFEDILKLHDIDVLKINTIGKNKSQVLDAVIDGLREKGVL